ncbi:hypothetical protein GGR54DRAFT_645078 [Hypoxylon sp. NC1633]|nr:hypothetical protein GGR54DRAFT_645078 [Hypoxylon sp. NC1633]
MPVPRNRLERGSKEPYSPLTPQRRRRGALAEARPETATTNAGSDSAAPAPKRRRTNAEKRAAEIARRQATNPDPRTAIGRNSEPLTSMEAELLESQRERTEEKKEEKENEEKEQQWNEWEMWDAEARRQLEEENRKKAEKKEEEEQLEKWYQMTDEERQQIMDEQREEDLGLRVGWRDYVENRDRWDEYHQEYQETHAGPSWTPSPPWGDTKQPRRKRTWSNDSQLRRTIDDLNRNGTHYPYVQLYEKLKQERDERLAKGEPLTPRVEDLPDWDAAEPIPELGRRLWQHHRERVATALQNRRSPAPASAPASPAVLPHKDRTLEELLRSTALTLNFVINVMDLDLDLSDMTAVRDALLDMEADPRGWDGWTVDFQTSAVDARLRSESITERLLAMSVREFVGLSHDAIRFSNELEHRGIRIKTSEW